MGVNQVVKKNLSGMQVIKTLQLLLENNYTMAELIEKLNENEQEPIFNNSVVSKYINTCRYCGIEIPKIHNKYFVAKLPFGLDLSDIELQLLLKLQKKASEKLANKSYELFSSLVAKIDKFSNKEIRKVEQSTLQETYELFEKAIAEKRKIELLYKVKATLECLPIGIVERKGKPCLKVLDNGKERDISVERISGIKLLKASFKQEEQPSENVLFRLTGGLAQRYVLREHEQEKSRNLPNEIIILNHGENKDELFARLLRYDKDCEIISPLKYREEMKTILNDMLKNYED